MTTETVAITAAAMAVPAQLEAISHAGGCFASWCRIRINNVHSSSERGRGGRTKRRSRLHSWNLLQVKNARTAPSKMGNSEPETAAHASIGAANSPADIIHQKCRVVSLRRSRSICCRLSWIASLLDFFCSSTIPILLPFCVACQRRNAKSEDAGLGNTSELAVS